MQLVACLTLGALDRTCNPAGPNVSQRRTACDALSDDQAANAGLASELQARHTLQLWFIHPMYMLNGTLS